MSQSNNKGKLIRRFEIGFDEETKATISSLKIKIDNLSRELSIKNESHGDRLLKVMQSEAANDAPQPELKELGQWVFEGQDDKWISAHVDASNRAYLVTLPATRLIVCGKQMLANLGFAEIVEYKILKGHFDTTNWQNSAINRQPVNDVDYLSSDLDESVSYINGMQASYIIIDELQSALLSESVPQITQADMQLIFIKDLSECLIQRMHNMDRFSEDDYHIGAAKFTPWDIIYDIGADRFGVVTAFEKAHISAVFLKPLSITVDTPYCFHKDTLLGQALRTITEDEITNFCAVLEAYHA